MKYQQCPCTGKTLARLLQPVVMALLAEEPQHGYSLIKRTQVLRMFQNHTPDTTGLYRLLISLEQSGFVRSEWDTKAKGPAKKYYKLTSSGKTCLRQWATTLSEYAVAIEEIVLLVEQQSKQRKG